MNNDATSLLQTPVSIFIFNRPSTTKRVFEQIRIARPKKLFIVADGPRCDEDIRLCNESISIVENIDWECSVEKNYSSENLGVVKRYITGIDWIFSISEEAIILDDDCVPDQSFFPYCAEMLEKYKKNEKVMLISGQTMTFPGSFSDYSYYFSKFALIWGWATWRDAWKRFHEGMNLWPHLRETNWLSEIIEEPILRDYWRKSFDRAYEGRVGTWDYQWMYIFFLHSGLSIIPSNNLISNIGFGPSSVNTKDPNSENANMPTVPLNFPLRHPSIIANNQLADKQIAERLWISRYKKNNYVVTDGFKVYK